MNVKEFYELISSRQTPAEDALPKLRFLVDKYPYFQGGLFTYLKCLYAHDSTLFDTELVRLATFVVDRKALFYYILSEEYSKFFQKRGKRELTKDRTLVLMEAFFETMGETSDEGELEHSIINSSMASLDYFSYIQSYSEMDKEHILQNEAVKTKSEELPEEKISNETATQMKHQSIIDSFMSKSEENGTDMKIAINMDSFNDDDDMQDYDEVGLDEELNDDDIFFTETLANIFIKQRKYEKAYEIIKRLSLNYPKKNIYFADQLAFLEKLIINTKNKKIK